MSRARNHWVLPVSVFLALLLGLLPLPADAAAAAAVLAGAGRGLLGDRRSRTHSALASPSRSACCADLAFGGLLGEQALRLVVMAFILQRFRAQLRFFPLSQQALAIGGLLLNDRVVSAAVHLALGEPQLPWSFWWAPLLGMLLWAPLFLLLDALAARPQAADAWVRAVASSSIPRSKPRSSARARRSVSCWCCWRSAALALWYFKLQVIDHADYATRSQANRVKPRPIVPGRGLIYDRKGRMLADNVPAYRLDVVPGRSRRHPQAAGRGAVEDHRAHAR